MSRSNFTPMKRFHEILNRYGLKLMEVGTNHRQWQQLTYPSMTDGAGKWETELDGIIRELMVQ